KGAKRVRICSQAPVFKWGNQDLEALRRAREKRSFLILVRPAEAWVDHSWKDEAARQDRWGRILGELVFQLSVPVLHGRRYARIQDHEVARRSIRMNTGARRVAQIVETLLEPDPIAEPHSDGIAPDPKQGFIPNIQKASMSELST